MCLAFRVIYVVLFLVSMAGCTAKRVILYQVFTFASPSNLAEPLRAKISKSNLPFPEENKLTVDCDPLHEFKFDLPSSPIGFCVKGQKVVVYALFVERSGGVSAYLNDESVRMKTAKNFQALLSQVESVLKSSGVAYSAEPIAESKIPDFFERVNSL